jgi:pimeloyl-ACP methyl ester carboxylesterase
MEGLIDELASGYRVATYQQRGLAPSTILGPFTVDQHVADVAAVLDALEWPRAHVVGHSWGGYLLVAAAARLGDRLISGVSVDPIGVVGDGGTAEFERRISERTPADVRTRAEELDRRAMAGEGTEEEALESMRLIWPAYFADAQAAPPMPEIRTSVDTYSQTLDSITDGMSALAAALPKVTLPVVFLYGTSSPIPASASIDMAALMPSADAMPVERAGHFIWLERPGVVRAALDSLVGLAQGVGGSLDG